MAKIETVLATLEDRLIIDQISDAWVPIGRGAGFEKFLEAWEKLFEGTDPSEPQELDLNKLTPEEQALVEPVLEVYPAIKVWGSLPVQRQQKIVEYLKSVACRKVR